jgi:hypothetical protein
VYSKPDNHGIKVRSEIKTDLEVMVNVREEMEQDKVLEAEMVTEMVETKFN